MLSSEYHLNNSIVYNLSFFGKKWYKSIRSYRSDGVVSGNINRGFPGMADASSTPSNYPFLQKIRKAKKASLKPCPYIKPSTKLRDYQSIGVIHFLSLSRMILGDGVGLGKCVSLDTYLPTTKGLRKLKEFLPKNLTEDTLYPFEDDCDLLTINGPVRPDAVYYCGKREGLRIRTQKGYEIVGLPHHPLYVPTESFLDYKRLDSLKVGDYVSINRKGIFTEEYYKISYEKKSTQSKLYIIPEILNEELSELLGFYVSEGHSSSQYGFVITQHDPDIHNRIRYLLQNIFGYVQNNNDIDYHKEIKVNSTEIFSIFENLGANMVDRSGGQIIPYSVLSSPKSVIAAFLRGYFEGDGSAEKSNKIISCSSKSEKLINQIQLLLLNFGVTARRKIKMVKVNEGRRPYHILYFCGKDIVNFQENIGFISNRKDFITEDICNRKRNSNNDIIPMGKILIKGAIKDITEHLKKLPGHKGFSVKGSGWKGLVGYHLKRMLEEVIYYKKRLTYELLNNFMSKVEELNLTNIIKGYDRLKAIQNYNFFYDKIVSIDPVTDIFADFHVPGEHNFTGNGFVNHNTLQMITSYVYRLMSEPDLKLVVVTAKSAMAQWSEEFDKFCEGISVHVLTNEYGEVREKGPNGRMRSTGEYGRIEDLEAQGKKFRKISGFQARKAQYKTVKAHVLIVNYFAVQEDYKFLIENRGPKFQVAYDECFEYHTPILLADGTTELIGKIVSQRKEVEVLSYNKERNIIEPKKVINFFKSPKTSWVKVKKRRTSSVICSPNHGFYTSEGKKRADELNPGDTIYSPEKKITDIQKQILLGSLLGDGSVRYTKRFLNGQSTGVKMMQSEQRLPYLHFKKELMGWHITSESSQTSGWNKVPMHTLGTESSDIMTNIIRDLGIINIKGKKIVTEKWLDTLTPLGLAVWYCDDGSIAYKKGVSVRINTQGFTRKENELIIEYFRQKWDLNFLIAPEKRKNKNLYSIRANTEDSIRFLEIVSDYIPTCMSYKTILKCNKFWETYIKEENNWELFEDLIESVNTYHFSKNTFDRYRYNIEVEGNHNYFANNILVSNCQSFKNAKTKTWFGANEISEASKYCYGMSATIIKNRLEEAYYIYRVIVPGLFPGKIKFFAEYTLRKKMTLWRKGRKRYINKIVGYQNLAKFKQIIDPFFLIRRTRDVASELPHLISRKLILEMSEPQSQLYRKALSGELYQTLIKEKYFKFEEYACKKGELSEKEETIFEKLKEKYEESLTKEGLQKNKIAALSYCQLVSNGPGWLNEDGESSKETEFKRLFDQELSDEKTIVFTRFKSGIKRLASILDSLGLKHVQITGDDSIDDRNNSRKLFQDMEKDYNVIFITQAGSAAINLQAAGVILYYDTPWSYGDLYQSIGRAQRIGSIREHILLLHMVNKETIDEHVLSILEGKKTLINQIVGDIAEGAIDFKDDEVLFKDDESDISALFNNVFSKVA